MSCFGHQQPVEVRVARHLLGLRKGFTVGSATARPDGALWDLSREEHQPELWWLQFREHPELLDESPPCATSSTSLREEVARIREER